MAVSQAATATGFQTFQVHPQLLEYGKSSTRLARTDLISAGVQVIASGGETNLHAHGGEDAIWLVMQGKARFYTTGDEVVATLGQHEALVIPREVPYWFESASDEENLVIMRIGAAAQNEERRRIDYQERQFAIRGDGQGVERKVQPIEGKFFGD